MKRRTIMLIFLLGAVVCGAALGAAGLLPVTVSAQEEDGDLEEFVPSEELPSDAAVAFPVDI